MSAGTTTVLVVVAGETGAGKNRLGSLVAQRTRLRLLHAVSGGPQLPGIDPTDLPDESEYVTLLEITRTALLGGQSAVLVAPFHTTASRKRLMKVASAVRCALLYVECSANVSVRMRRLRDRIPLELRERIASKESIAPPGVFEPVFAEIPRACQMLVDTTVGIDLWAGLAAGRVETYLALGAASAVNADQLISAG